MRDHSIDLWAFDGFAVKSLDDSGRFEGLAVPFGNVDLSSDKDVFTAETYFGRALKSGEDVLYYHGLPMIGSEPNPFRDVILGSAEFTIKTDVDEPGVWMRGQLELRDKYEAKVWEMVKAGRLGVSTGAAAHRVRRDKQGDGTHQIKAWPIAEVSLTPTPANHRTSVYALKTLLDDSEPPESVGFVEALKRAESALAWAIERPDLNGVKAEAIKTLTETVKRFNASRIDPAKVKDALAMADRLLTRKGYQYVGGKDDQGNGR